MVINFITAVGILTATWHHNIEAIALIGLVWFVLLQLQEGSINELNEEAENH